MLRGIVLDYAGVLTEVDAPRLFELLDVARDEGIRTALLSNAAGGGVLARRLAAWFDTLVFSGEVGVAKPHVEAYRLTVDRLGLAPGACVLVDDARPNVAGAVATGMIGIHHTSVAETVFELETLFPAIG